MLTPVAKPWRMLTEGIGSGSRGSSDGETFGRRRLMAGLWDTGAICNGAQRGLDWARGNWRDCPGRILGHQASRPKGEARSLPGWTYSGRADGQERAPTICPSAWGLVLRPASRSPWTPTPCCACSGGEAFRSVARIGHSSPSHYRREPWASATPARQVSCDSGASEWESECASCACTVSRCLPTHCTTPNKRTSNHAEFALRSYVSSQPYRRVHD